MLDFVSKIGTRRKIVNFKELPLLLTCDSNEYDREASIGIDRRRYILARTMHIHFESGQTVPTLAKARYDRIHGIIQGPKETYGEKDERRCKEDTRFERKR